MFARITINMITKTMNKSDYFLLKVEGPIRSDQIDGHVESIQKGINREKDILIDLTDCEFVISNTLGIWLHTMKYIKPKKLILINHSVSVNILLRSTGVYEAFNIATSLAVAEEMI